MNFIPKIAKMFNLEIGERFQIVIGKGRADAGKVVADNAYFNETGLILRCWLPSSSVLEFLITGKYEVKKMPWRPNNGETYFIPSIDFGVAQVYSRIWDDSPSDNYMWENNFICRTAEEAYKKAKKMLQTLKDM